MSRVKTIRISVVSNDPKAGKTSLVRRYINDMFIEEYDPTVADNFVTQVDVDGMTERVEILDSSGDDEFQALHNEWIDFGDAFMIVFDLTQRDQFDFMKECASWRDKIFDRKGPVGTRFPMVLVGTKGDLEENIDVQSEDAEELARDWNIRYFETSALDNINVREAFNQLVREYRFSSSPHRVRQRRGSSFIQTMFPAWRSWEKLPSDSVKSQRLLRRGYLWKKGFLNRQWKKRFFLLFDDGLMQYFESDNDIDKPKGEIDLSECHGVSKHSEEGHDSCFCVVSAERNYYFDCGSPRNLQNWYDEIHTWMNTDRT